MSKDEFSDENMVQIAKDSVEYDIRELRRKWACNRTDEEERFLYLVEKIETLQAVATALLKEKQ